MSVSAPCPPDHPLMIAWNAYKATEEYPNTKKWAVYPEHVEGSLWAAFMAGFNSQSVAISDVKAALDECDLSPGGSLADRVRALTHHHREWKEMFALSCDKRAEVEAYAVSLRAVIQDALRLIDVVAWDEDEGGNPIRPAAINIAFDALTDALAERGHEIGTHNADPLPPEAHVTRWKGIDLDPPATSYAEAERRYMESQGDGARRLEDSQLGHAVVPQCYWRPGPGKEPGSCVCGSPERCPSQGIIQPEPICWLRTIDGSPDWGEDCVGDADVVVNGYAKEDGYDAIPLYKGPMPSQDAKQECPNCRWPNVDLVGSEPKEADRASRPRVKVPGTDNQYFVCDPYARTICMLCQSDQSKKPPGCPLRPPAPEPKA